MQLKHFFNHICIQISVRLYSVQIRKEDRDPWIYIFLNVLRLFETRTMNYEVHHIFVCSLKKCSINVTDNQVDSKIYKLSKNRNFRFI